MGYELRRQLREALGPDITGLQRAVALEIADDANDNTRESWVKLEDLARWTAAKDTNVVRNALKRLAAAGWEFRVPIGKGKDGRALYAVPGKRMTFRVPDFEGVATATPKEEPPLPHGVATATPHASQGVAPAHSGVAGAPSQGAGATPFSSNPSDPSVVDAASTPASKSANNRSSDARSRCQPLIDEMTRRGMRISWQMQAREWIELGALVASRSVPVLVDHAERVWQSSRTPPYSARYFLPGWQGLPEIPEGSAPALRSVSGGYEPYRNPVNQDDYDQPFWSD